MSQPQAGRPKVYTEAEERKVVRYAQIYPKDFYTLVKKAFDLSFSHQTIKRILVKHGIVN